MENNISEKSRLGALLFAFFLGTLGVHRFYVGRPGSAIIMLLLTMTIVGIAISGIWAIVDFFIIGCGKFRDGKGKIVIVL